MADYQVEHEEVVADMEAFDALPRSLRVFLDTAPVGVTAEAVKELYEDKLAAGWMSFEAAEQVIKTLREYMRRNEGVVDWRPVVARKKY